MTTTVTLLDTPRTILRRVRRMLGRLRDALAGRGVFHLLRWRMTSRQAVFTRIYASATWGSAESGSGTGSELRATEDVRAQLPGLLIRLGATSLLDAPCGDFNWMQRVDLPVEKYYGVDIVAPVIAENQRRYGDSRRSFAVADLTEDDLPRADVILCRDCLVHVSFADAARIVENFRSTGATWLLLNTYPEIERNRNQFTGSNWRRLNVTLPPFNFPEPIESIADGGDVDPSRLSLWKLQELPIVQQSASRTEPR